MTARYPAHLLSLTNLDAGPGSQPASRQYNFRSDSRLRAWSRAFRTGFKFKFKFRSDSDAVMAISSDVVSIVEHLVHSSECWLWAADCSCIFLRSGS